MNDTFIDYISRLLYVASIYIGIIDSIHHYKKLRYRYNDILSMIYNIIMAAAYTNILLTAVIFLGKSLAILIMK